MRKGALYTLDATLAIFMVVIAVLAINGYTARIGYNKLILAQPVEVASDMMTTFHYQGYLSDFYIQNGYFFNGSVMDKHGGRHGILQGNAEYVVHLPYHRFHMDLAGGSVDISVLPLFLSESSVTHTFWVYPRACDGTIIQSDDFSISLDNDCRIEVEVHATSTTVSPETFVINAWNFVGVAYNTTHLQFLVNDDPLPIPLVDSGVHMENFALGNADFDGMVDDVRIFSRGLTAQELQTISQNNTVSAGLFSRYDFNVMISATNTRIATHLPQQYAMALELREGDTVISNRERVSPNILHSFIAAGDRVIAVTDDHTIRTIMDVRYYVWTR